MAVMRWSVGGDALELELDAVVVAGYTGRDRAALQHHIDELAALGVPRPASVPAYWMLPPFLASQEPLVTVSGSGTSGEAELCLVVDGDDVYVSLASDHTDRDVESVDIALSKGICPKPVAREAWPISSVEGRWDELELRSWIHEGTAEVAYQDGSVSTLTPAPELLAGLPFGRPRRFMMLCGTMPVIGGIRPAGRFRAELRDPGRDRALTLAYDIRSLERS